MKFRRYPLDPVLLRSDFRCAYCGRDLLSDLDTFLSLVRDHLVPKSAGGPDGAENRVACCATCDRLQADAMVVDVDQARALVARQRSYKAIWFERVCQAVRNSEAVAPG